MNDTIIKVKLPIIIEYDIIELILDYLLKGDRDENKNYFIRYKYLNNNNQIIKLSIVCKRWFNKISNIISNNIDECLKQFNGKGEWSIYYEGYENKTKFNIPNIDGKWSLIKVDPLIVNEYYHSQLKTYSYNPNSWLYLNKKQIYLHMHNKNINIREDDNELFIKLFNNRKSLPPSIFRIVTDHDLKLDKPFELDRNDHAVIVPLTFNTLGIQVMHLSYGELFEMGLLKSKRLMFRLESIENCKEIMSKICCDSNSNDNLKSIIILNKFDITSIKYLNKMVNLETLSIYMKFNNYNQDDWISMVESLSNNKYLKRLILNYTNGSYDIIDIENISIGIKKILKLNTSIKYLMLSNFNMILPSTTWSGLLSNQTLKTLELTYDNNDNNINNNNNYIIDLTIKYLFSTIFNISNKSQIRHFIIESKSYSVSTTQILELLIKYPNSSLYSIKFQFNLKDHFDLLLNLLSLPNLTINEFILKVDYSFDIDEFYKLPELKKLKNNKIINIRY